jgi:hypothetical protein
VIAIAAKLPFSEWSIEVKCLATWPHNSSLVAIKYHNPAVNNVEKLLTKREQNIETSN